MPRLFIFIIVLALAGKVNAQFMKESTTRALDTLNKLKPLFQKTSNDSVFITKYSDEKYRLYFFLRGDQEADIEEQIYKTKVGEVAGPFRGENNKNFLFKVLSFEGYTTRNKATIMYLKPEDASKTDTTYLKKLANKYSDALAKGKNIREMGEKDKVRVLSKELDYYYEEQKDREYYDLVVGSSKGKTFVVNSDQGPAILIVTSDKEKVPYKVKLVAVVKKG